MSKNKIATKWIRVLLPSLLIVGWLSLAAFGAPFFGKIGSLSSTNLSDFLPKDAEATIANNELGKFVGNRTIPIIVVFEKSGDKLSSTDLDKIKSVNGQLNRIDGVEGTIAAPIQSDDGKAAITVVPLVSDGDFKVMVPAIKSKLAGASLPVTSRITGPASFAYDLQHAFSGIDSTLLVVAVAVVFIILLIVYRSPFLPFIVLGSAMAALAAVVLVVYHLADAGIVKMNGQVQGILFILVIGAATDYSLLYIARYREELTEYESTWRATWAALRSSSSAIIAAGATVSAGLLCMLFSGLESNKALGPVGAIGVTFAVIVTLTLLPSLLLAFGRTVFWPKKPKHTSGKSELHYLQNHPVWARIGVLVHRHPRRIWVGSMLVLLIACVGITGLKADGVRQSDLVVGPSDARDGQKILDAHFPSGSGSPAYIIARKDSQDAVVKAIDSDKGVSSVNITVTGASVSAIPTGKTDEVLRNKIKSRITVQRDQELADMNANIAKRMTNYPPQYINAAYVAAIAKVPSIDQLAAQAYPFKDAKIKTADGNVLIQAILTDPADSLSARDTITRLRSDVKKVDSSALIGGATAAQLDTNVSSQRDIRVVMPLILIAITIILMVLLRAIIAPLVLLITTILSFSATLGIAAFLFNDVWHFAGADPAVVIFSFVFLVALGIDYNIFLMTRVREETVKSGVSKGTIKGLVVTGGVITSAGIVLASTFASLSVIPILFLVEIAFIVTFGVLLDTIIVRSLLVPSFTLEIGRIMWWPSKLWRGKK